MRLTGLICKDRIAIFIANVSWCCLILNSFKLVHHLIDEKIKEGMKITGNDLLQSPLYFPLLHDTCLSAFPFVGLILVQVLVIFLPPSSV